MSTIDEIRKKVDDLTDKVFVEGYRAGYEKGIKVTVNTHLSWFLEWLDNEVAIIGKDQDGKTHILVARRVQDDSEKLVWADAVQEFNLKFPMDPVDPKDQDVLQEEKIKLNHPSDQMEKEVSE